MLELRNVSFRVLDDNDQHRNILTDISVNIPSGCFVAITGPNGSGKSSLAKIIMV